MILARSRRQLLSGNKFLFLILCLLYSCSPKTRPTEPGKETEILIKEEVASKDINRGGPAKFALLLPFNAQSANLNNASQLESSGMAIDFYQGFTLGMDLAAGSGRNYQLRVLDSESKAISFANLQNNAKLKDADIVIGPVFPENIKQVDLGNQYIISPIAAADPIDFNNTKVISLTPHLTLHAARISGFIKNTYNNNNSMVVLLKGPKGDEIFVDKINSDLNVAERNYNYQTYASVTDFETKVQRSVKYVIVLGSNDRATVIQAIDRLIALKNRYALNITLIGHPTWEKQNYPVEKLQTLNTLISSGHYVNFKAAETISFLQNYRTKYGLEPTEFAFKGFDAGYYFADLLVDPKDTFPHILLDNTYKGLHNSYVFEFDQNRGYVNKSVWMLRYKDFQLTPVN